MKRLLALLLLSCFAACSGDNSTAPTNNNPGGGGGGGGGTLQDSLRVTTLRAIAHTLDSWNGQDPDSIAVHAVAYLHGLPTIKNAGVTPGTTTVWANFTDGFSLIIPNNRDPSTAADTLVDQASLPAPRSAAAPRHVVIPAGRRMMTALRVPTSALELPAPATFVAINAIGTCHINPLPVIKKLLRDGHYADQPTAPTVAGFKSINNPGVLYINSHGGPGFDKNLNPYYAVWTADSVDVATLAAYKTMLANHELVGMAETSNDATGNCRKVIHWGITSAFVRAHMHLARNSLVIVDACSSASAPAADLRAAFAAVGASAYVGWTKTVDANFAYRSMKYLIDRILGVNEISPETPRQRAFNIDQVRDDMANHRNMVDDPHKDAILTVFHMKDDFGLLAPTVQFLSIDDNGIQPRLIIAGLFGTDPGASNRSVTINGQELDNIDWHPTEIDCDIPETGANAHGTVVVKVGSGAHARASNPVNITEWQGELDYDRDEPGDQAAHMKIKVRILADIHDFRDDPGEPPFKTTVLFQARRGTSVEATTSGSFSRPIGNCTETTTLGQGGNLTTPFEGSLNGTWIYFGSVDTQNHTLQLNIAVLAGFVAGTWVINGSDPQCTPFNQPLHVSMVIDDCLYDDLVQSPAFRMQMTNDFTVGADSRGPCTVDPIASPLQGDYQSQATIHWNDMTPVFLPDPDAAR
jgi:hypothetical protein